MKDKKQKHQRQRYERLIVALSRSKNDQRKAKDEIWGIEDPQEGMELYLAFFGSWSDSVRSHYFGNRLGSEFSLHERVMTRLDSRLPLLGLTSDQEREHSYLGETSRRVYEQLFSLRLREIDNASIFHE